MRIGRRKAVKAARGPSRKRALSRRALAVLWERLCLPHGGSVIGADRMGLWYDDVRGSTHLVPWPDARTDVAAGLRRKRRRRRLP